MFLLAWDYPEVAGEDLNVVNFGIECFTKFLFKTPFPEMETIYLAFVLDPLAGDI